MIVDLEDKEVAGTFELPGGGKIHLRLRNEADEKKIRAACITSAVEYPLLDGKYQRFESEKTDVDLYYAMGTDANISGWEGILDKNEKPIPCTLENKVLLMKLSPVFRDAVSAGIKALKEKEEKEAKESEKN